MNLGAQRSCFVPWAELPPKHVGDETRVNWVFLADIVENQTIMTTPTYAIRDIAGRTLMLAIYPTGRHSSMIVGAGTFGADGRRQFFAGPSGPGAEKLRSMQAGSMVAVNNCVAHWFLDGRFGVRLDEDKGDLKGFKHFSCTVSQFFELNRRRRAADQDASAPCRMCSQPGATKCCTKCKAKYCSQECQLKHWGQGHKNECRILTAQREYDNLVV